ncbi:MAG: DNA-directed RNA polymerase subunit omega [Limnochordaceae bacterium]|nr:DNA-directed RNA polymerase subunit omega [Limnochordaceae bacterium]
MDQPPLEILREKVDSRYTLVVVTAKRARELVDGARPLVGPDDKKPVSIALEEIAEGKVKYERTKAAHP